MAQFFSSSEDTTDLSRFADFIQDNSTIVIL